MIKEKIQFSDKEENPAEIVRAIIFQMLKENALSQVPISTEPFHRYGIEFIGNDSVARQKFMLLVHEIIWELIIQRVITPGCDTANPNLPFFRVTDYGRKVLAGEEYKPHDPTNYLDKYQRIVETPDPIAFEYLKESLRSFNSGCYLASVMMLGIASERVFLSLCETLLDALSDKTEKEPFKKILNATSMIAKQKFVQDKLTSFMSKNRKALPDNTRTSLLGIFDFIRTQRNDIGHPQDDLQIPERDTVYVNLRLFPQYCKTVEIVKNYLKNSKI